MGKLIQPEDIAETILFLAGEQASMITGQECPLTFTLCSKRPTAVYNCFMLIILYTSFLKTK